MRTFCSRAATVRTVSRRSRPEGGQRGLPLLERPNRRYAVDGSETGRTAPRPFTDASELPEDVALVAGLRARDEEIFGRLIDAWAGTMLRLARSHVHTGE